MSLVKDFDALQAAAQGTLKPHTIQLASLAIEPGTVQLQPGGSIRLEITGRLPNGQPAPAAVLAGAAWSAANPAVASVTSPGTVTGGEHGQHPCDGADRQCPGLSAGNSRRWQLSQPALYAAC